MAAENDTNRLPMAPPARRGVGLRARIWMGTLLGGAVSGVGIWWVIYEITSVRGEIDRTWLVTSLASVAGAGFVVALLGLIWLDRGIVVHLRGLLGGMRSGRVADLRGLPSAGGWGELSALTEHVQLLLAYQRQALRAAEDVGAVRRQVAVLQAGLAEWTQTERWTALGVEPGVLTPAVEQLNEAARRHQELTHQHAEVAAQVRNEVAQSQEEGRGGSEQAERAFVEATALLTTIRELQRLSVELDGTLDRGPVPAAGAEDEAWRQTCRAAIDELVVASAQSVEHIGQGLNAVGLISDQVEVLSNRATLLALNFALATTRSPQAAPELGDVALEMKGLARDVRTSAERMGELTSQVSREVQSAAVRMATVREKVAQRLEAPLASASRRVPDDASRLRERVREMVQDAGQKAERMVVVAERTSRAAERSLRSLEESLSELDGLLARLGGARVPADVPPPLESPQPLRLLTPEDVVPLDDAGEEQRP